MNLTRNEWYELTPQGEIPVLIRWRDATADQIYTVYCVEIRTGEVISAYEEFTSEEEAIATVETAIAGVA